MTSPPVPRPGAAKLALGTGCAAGLALCIFVVLASLAKPGASVLTGIAAGVMGGLLVSVAGAWIGMRFANPPPPPPPLDEARADSLTAGLGPVLAELEAARQATITAIKARALWRVPLGVAAGALLWMLPGDSDNDSVFDLFGQMIFCGGLGYVWAAAPLQKRYRLLYKQRVLPRLASGFGDLSWRLAALPDLERFRKAGIFGDFDGTAAEDELFGTYRKLPLSIIELNLTRGSGDNETIVFNGLLTEITLPRGLAGSTAIVASEGLLASVRDWLGDDGRSRVKLEDPEFEAVYQVWSTDQIAARALLTPAFMERLLALARSSHIGRPLALTEANRLTMVIPRYGRLFEPPSYFKPAASHEALVALHDDIAAVLAVADTVIDLDYAARSVAGSA